MVFTYVYHPSFMVHRNFNHQDIEPTSFSCISAKSSRACCQRLSFAVETILGEIPRDLRTPLIYPYIHIHIYTYIHIHIYTYTHAHIYPATIIPEDRINDLQVTCNGRHNWYILVLGYSNTQFPKVQKKQGNIMILMVYLIFP